MESSTQFSDFLTITSIIVAIFVAAITWLLSYIIFRAQKERKKLVYMIQLYPVLTKLFSRDQGSLEIFYNKQRVDELHLLEVDIRNVGKRAVIQPPIYVETTDDALLIPGYFESIPAGYEDKWKIEKISEKKSKICLKHINPKQTVRARFVMDKTPKSIPIVYCAMEDLAFEQRSLDKYEPFANVVLEILSGGRFDPRKIIEIYAKRK